VPFFGAVFTIQFDFRNPAGLTPFREVGGEDKDATHKVGFARSRARKVLREIIHQ
jgi:hypothetical protein